MILDSYERVGDNWRSHWDSLRLYSPARAASLPGMRFPGPRAAYPSRDEMADFLDTYRATFDLPSVAACGWRGCAGRTTATSSRPPTGRRTSATTS